MEKKQEVTAQNICEDVGELVGGERARQHGDKMETHQRIADFWSVYLRWCSDPTKLKGEDVCNLQELLKIARRMGGKHNLDDYRDGVGYAAIAGELAEKTNVLPDAEKA